MAFLYRAELRPTKLELLNSWLPAQPWAQAGPGEPWSSVATFRFDDPDGEVGIETFILAAGDTEVHVPVTYRGAPLADAEQSLIGTMEHSVLGSRWVYDACGDPVYVRMLASTILSGGTEAELFVEENGRRQQLDSTAQVRGSGTGSGVESLPTSMQVSTSGAVTTIVTPDYELCVLRRIGGDLPADVTGTLIGTWPTHPELGTLAGLIRRG